MENPTLLDPVNADVRVAFGLAEAEYAFASVSRNTAELMRAIVSVLAEARRHPEVYVGDLPVPDAERRDFAQRAAVADLATRIGMAEGTVIAYERQAVALRRATPGLWARFADGEVSVPNMRAVADRIPEIHENRYREFDEAASRFATLAPSRFAVRLRRLVEQLCTEPLTVRQRRAESARRVFLDHDRDGMAWFGIHLPAVAGELAWAHVDGAARSLAAADGETRTLDQLRADVARDLLTSPGAASSGTGTGTGTGVGVGVTVAVTVPVLTLLGVSDVPGTLEGRIPVDAETARHLAGDVPTWQRILTDPVSGTVLDVDRRSYRVPADLARWLRVRDVTCTFPGCGRSANGCDLDHTVAWADGGATSASNLAALCRNHHRLKHNTGWRVERDADGPTWTSPTGETHRAHPPPPF